MVSIGGSSYVPGGGGVNWGFSAPFTAESRGVVAAAGWAKAAELHANEESMTNAAMYLVLCMRLMLARVCNTCCAAFLLLRKNLILIKLILTKTHEVGSA